MSSKPVRDNGDDSNSDAVSIQNIQNGAQTSQIEQELVEKLELRALFTIRVLTFLVLLIVALAICLSVYLFNSSSEEEDFQDAFREQAFKLSNAFSTKASDRLGALTGFAENIKAHAHSRNDTWPFVTLPEFDKQGRIVMDLASLVSLVLIPIVAEEEREQWEAYAWVNQGFVSQGLADHETRVNPNWVQPSNWSDMVGTIPSTIVDTKGYETAPGPYTPTWQHAPTILPKFMNYNLIENSKYTDAMTAMINTGQVIISVTYVPFNKDTPDEKRKSGVLGFYLERWKDGGNFYLDDPVSDLYFPIFDSKNGATQLVAMFKCFIYWRTYLIDILPEGNGPLLCVLENSCGDVYSYEVSGPNVEFLGEGDLHQPEYGDMYHRVDFSSFQIANGPSLSQQEQIAGNCIYTLTIYPTEEMEDKYVTNGPLMYALILGLVFLVTTAIFIVYDWLVRRQQRKLFKKAVQSGSIVSQLFPKAVRDRMYEEQQRASRNQNGNGSAESKRARIFMPENDIEDIADTMPIADLFPSCTVLFMDVAGFTSWSSNRQPTEVFLLLERIYGAFDSIAKKYGVFKVETIGDSYVAVTGLPEPQQDHATIMCRFAIQCLKSLSRVTKALAPELGDDTAKLSIRVGLHSGPVTAGVLRGLRSRFQLFGDTVNTAARMEHTGVSGKIQVSESTAEILRTSGYGDWISPRNDLVNAKGKGVLQTYWLLLTGDSSVAFSQIENENNAADASGDEATEVCA